MMTDKQINDLLDRFMAGETSEQEERLLTDYFCEQTDIPEEWAAHAVMFRGFRQTADEKICKVSKYNPGTTGGHCEVPSSSFHLFSPLGHPRFQAPPLTRLHSACCSSLIPSITLWDKDDFGET
jgi:hypothetical protein